MQTAKKFCPNVMYNTGKKMSMLMHKENHSEDLKLENSIILTDLCPNTFTINETKDIQYAEKLLE